MKSSQSWVDLDIFPESIPHLLHWDLAYFWILEKKNLKPKTWNTKIEAWRYLVKLLFLGKLDIKKENIEEFTQRYTGIYGINDVSWVCIQGIPIGVLSPTVLVRPLPDFKDNELKQWQEKISISSKEEDEFYYLISKAVESIKNKFKGESESFGSRLANILEQEFNSDKKQPPRVEHTYQFQILTRIDWVGDKNAGDKNAEPPLIQSIDLLIKGEGLKIFVPRCKGNKCLSILTQEENSDPIDVDSDVVKIKCSKCTTENEIPLSDFLIWNKKDSKVVVVWEEIWHTAPPAKGSPPRPKIQNDIIEFDWKEEHLDGEKKKKYLKLRFKDKKVSAHKIDEIFFSKIIVPGELKDFNGLPFKIEWRDAIKNLDDIQQPNKGQDTEKDNEIIFPNIKIEGYPESITKTFTSFSQIKEKGLSAGIYPDPEYVPENWKWYRIFLHGQKSNKYRIDLQDEKIEILPYLVEVKNNPQSFSITSVSDKDRGVTYYAKPSHKIKIEGGTCSIGVDFGTTNSILYFRLPDESTDNCLKPSELGSIVKWLAESKESYKNFTICSFLPSSRYGEEEWTDKHIIPSALWELKNNQHIIRWWGEEPPEPDVKPLSQFKWGTNTYSVECQKSYLKEILLLSFPLILKKAKENNKAIKDFRMGIAYPLAFGHNQRQKMERILKEFEKELKENTGFDFKWVKINESSACVRGFGKPNPGDTFLIADLGGGTMDVALFTITNSSEENMHQIGSVKFGGEKFLEILATKKQTDAEEVQKFQWELRDLIVRGECSKKYGNDSSAGKLRDAFIYLIMEFLRTMVEAHLVENRGGKINLVLVGNGWHLVESFSDTSKKGPVMVFNDYFDLIKERLGIDELNLFRNDPLPNLPSSKHLVAKGALETAVKEESQDMINKIDSDLSKLPAGRQLKFLRSGQEPAITIEWYQMVGGGEKNKFNDCTQEELVNGGIDFYFDQMPPFKKSWKKFLLTTAFNKQEDIPHPSPMRLRSMICDSIDTSQPITLRKGPLQIILETFWSEELKKQ